MIWKPVLSLGDEYDVGLPPRNGAERAGLIEHAELGGAARRRALSLARRSAWFTRTPAAFLG
jgi:hypothetical protein